MSHRRIVGLEWARQLTAKPKAIPTGRPRGAKAAGVRYERALARELVPGGFQAGVWFEFRDRGGSGWCQPDLILVGTRSVLVLEAKYTWTRVGHEQIEFLYRPVLERVFDLPVKGVVVCRVLIPETRECCVIGDLASALAVPAGTRSVLHWLPGTRLGTWGTGLDGDRAGALAGASLAA